MGCSEKSELRKTEIAEGLYTKREISKDYTLYWRVLPDTQEIEIAMKVKGMYLVNISEIRSLCLIKCSSQMLQTLQYISKHGMSTNNCVCTIFISIFNLYYYYYY